MSKKSKPNLYEVQLSHKPVSKPGVAGTSSRSNQTFLVLADSAARAIELAERDLEAVVTSQVIQRNVNYSEFIVDSTSRPLAVKALEWTESDKFDGITSAETAFGLVTVSPVDHEGTPDPVGNLRLNSKWEISGPDCLRPVKSRYDSQTDAKRAVQERLNNLAAAVLAKHFHV